MLRVTTDWMRLDVNIVVKGLNLRGYPGENHAKGATAHITDLAHTLHIDITQGSIDRYGIRLVQACFICVSQGGPFGKPFLPSARHKFCDYLNDNIFFKLHNKVTETNYV